MAITLILSGGVEKNHMPDVLGSLSSLASFLW